MLPQYHFLCHTLPVERVAQQREHRDSNWQRREFGWNYKLLNTTEQKKPQYVHFIYAAYQNNLQ